MKTTLRSRANPLTIGGALPLLAAALSLACTPSRAAVEDYITGIDLNFLGYRDGNLYWKSDCGQPAFSQSFIGSEPSAGGLRQTIYWPLGCAPIEQPISGVARSSDGSHYWVHAAGTVRRNAPGGVDPNLTTTPDPTKLPVNGPVAVSDGFVFWTEDHGFELSIQSKIFRVARSAGAASPVIDFTTRAGNRKVLKIHPHSDNQITLLTNGGHLVRADRVFIKIPAPGSFVWLESEISTSATACTVYGDRLYWVDRSSDDKSFFFRSAPVGDTASHTLHHLAFQAIAHSVREIAVDENNLFYQDLTAGTGSIWRIRLADNFAEEISEPLGYVATHMVSDGRHVLWRRDDHTISRLPVDAAAVTRDLAPTGMEVVQAIQNQNNENPLVHGKTTFVRVFAQIIDSSAGEAEIVIWPGTILHGTKDGSPLPGSPLLPHRSVPIRAAPSFRTVLEQSFVYRLPDSWTRQGEIQLTAQVNPGRPVRETNYANNTRTGPFDFLRKAPICMRMKPCRTTSGVIREYDPSFQPIFDYAEVLLPTSELHVVWSGGLLEELEFLDYGPYEVSDSDKDGDKILAKLRRKKIFSASPSPCDPLNGFEHYCSILKFPHPNNYFSGYASVGGPRRNRPSTIFFEGSGTDTLGVPTRAATLAQELGHNYARRHVDCGDPKNVDRSYPYEPCDLSSSAAGYIGFDPLSRKLILRDGASDFMSYGSPKWVSDYTWKKLANRLGNMPDPPAPAPAGEGEGEGGGAAGTPTRLVTGSIHLHDEHASFDAIYKLDAAEKARALEILDAGDPSEDFELHAYAGASFLAAYPIVANAPPADEGATEDPIFMALVEFPSTVTRIELVDKSAPGSPAWGEIGGGGAAPTVTVTRPALGETVDTGDPLVVEWTGNDADGDTLKYLLRISNDSGATWTTLVDDYPMTELTIDAIGLPGGFGTCQVEVLASDGILSSSGLSEQFTLEPKQPKAFIFHEDSEGKHYDQPASVTVSFAELCILHGVANDDEDGPLTGDQLFWQVTGPENRAGNGDEFDISNLAPGTYSAMLTAFDSNQSNAEANLQVIVDPIFIEEAGAGTIKLDGLCDDPGYRVDLDSLPVRYPSEGLVSSARMVHSDGNLYACVNCLPIGTDPGEFVALSIDPDASAEQTPGSGDLRFLIFRDGTIRSQRGDGIGFVDDATPDGFAGRVSQDGDTWTVELCIDDSRLGGWSGQTMRVGLVHGDRTAPGDNAVMPCNLLLPNPATWAEAVAGPQPEPPSSQFSTGDLYVLDNGSDSILRISPDGQVSIHVKKEDIGDLPGVGSANISFEGNGLGFDPAGNLYFTNNVQNRHHIYKAGADGSLGFLAEQSDIADDLNLQLLLFKGLTVGENGNPIAVETAGDNVVEIDAQSGTARYLVQRQAISDLPGIGGFSGSSGIAVGPGGQVVITDVSSDALVSVDGNGTPSVFAIGQPLDSLLGNSFLARAPDGSFAVTDFSPIEIVRINANGNPSVFLSRDRLNAAVGDSASPRGIAFDSVGNFYFADSRTDAIYKFDARTKTSSVFASKETIRLATGRNPAPGAIAFGPRNFALWQQSNFGAAELANLSISGFSANFDDDLLSNGLEYLLGSNPRDNSPAGGSARLPRANVVEEESGTRLTLEFAIPDPPPNDATYEVQCSGDLNAQTWITITTKSGAARWSGPAIVRVGEPVDGRRNIIVEDVVELGVPLRRFMRLVGTVVGK